MVKVHGYLIGEFTDRDMAGYVEASQIKLMADLEDCDSFLFILEDGETFQDKYQALSRLDGSLPEGIVPHYEDCYIAWNDSPALRMVTSAKEMDSSLPENLVIGRRGFYSEKTVRCPEAAQLMWETILEGVER